MGSEGLEGCFKVFSLGNKSFLARTVQLPIAKTGTIENSGKKLQGLTAISGNLEALGGLSISRIQLSAGNWLTWPWEAFLWWKQAVGVWRKVRSVFGHIFHMGNWLTPFLAFCSITPKVGFPRILLSNQTKVAIGSMETTRKWHIAKGTSK